MFRPEEIFDALFGRATDGKGGERLFGLLAKDRALLHEKLCGRPFSLLFLEFPLEGEAGFDLHIIHDAEDIRRGAPFSEEVYGGHGQLFSWFAAKGKEGDGLDVVHDLREGTDAPPMVYLKTAACAPELTDGFFRRVWPEGAARFREKKALLPEGWCVWYTGVHTGRQGNPLRIGSFLSAECQKSYAKNISLFENVLAAVGFPVPLGPMMKDKLQELFAFPFPVDIQLDVMEDGSVGDTLGISLGTGQFERNEMAASFKNGAAKQVMRLWEEWGIADDRWKEIPGATYAVSAALHSSEGGTRRYILSGRVGFLKVRFRGGCAIAQDAKAYIKLEAIEQKFP